MLLQCECLTKLGDVESLLIKQVLNKIIPAGSVGLKNLWSIFLIVL